MRVKICGLREPEQARVAIDAGADLIGVVFAESTRRASIEQGRALRAAIGPRTPIFESTADAVDAALVRAGRPLLVGVFAKQTPDEINRIATAVDLDLIQLSGGEHPSLVTRLQRPALRVIHVESDTTPAAVLAEARRRPPAVTLLDTPSGRGGGSGRRFDWAVAAAVAREHPLVLAGGLSPDNVAEAVALVRPWAVDVSSGVETEGVKDPAKIRAFLIAARAACDAPAGSQAPAPTETPTPTKVNE